jgi:hypothetical protein
MGVDPLNAIKSVIDLSDQAIKVLKPHFVRQSDPALDHLETVLDEISKIFNAMNTAITSYLALSFDPTDRTSLNYAISRLLELEGGKVEVEMSQARGRSSKIQNIYKKYLDPWFQRVLDSDENIKISNLFNDLSYSDSQMTKAIEELANSITMGARETMNLVNQDRYQEANEFIKNERTKMNPTRLVISSMLVALYKLQDEFIEKSGAL